MNCGSTPHRRPVIRALLLTIPKARLSTSPCFLATGRSPTAKGLGLVRKKPNSIPRASADRILNWPINIFKQAFKSGAVPVSAAQSMFILDDYAKLGKLKRPTTGDVEQLCQDHGIESSTLTMLAKVLLRAGLPEHYSVATSLLLSASEQRDAEASKFLISEAIRNSKLSSPSIAPARSHLRQLVEAGSPSAMMLQARILEIQGEPERALHLYEKSVGGQANSDNPAIADSIDDLGEAWMAIAKLKAKNRDESGAEKAYEIAAFQYDDPWAYYWLADRRWQTANPQALQYMLKAASSGVVLAAHKLGLHYFAQGQAASLSRGEAPVRRKGTGKNSGDQQIENNLEPVSSSDAGDTCWKMAAAWFRVAAESPDHSRIGESRLYLAITLRKLGEDRKGLEWLETAAKSSPIRDPGPVLQVREGWYNKQVDFTRMDVLGRDVALAEGARQQQTAAISSRR